MKESAFGSAVRLIEEALILIKRLDARAWLIYAAGIVPFFALLVFETTDLAQNPFAPERLPEIALALAVLYFWLHICQSLFCACLHATLTETAPALRAHFRPACAAQLAIAGSKLLLWPLAFSLVAPHAVVTMFYQHSLLPPVAAHSNWREALAEARRDAVYRQPQAWWMLALVFVLRLVLFANLEVLLYMAPALWKTMTSREGMLTRSPALLDNPTSFAAVCVLAYIGLDPIAKAACVLRRFARASERSGVDLRLRASLLQRAIAVAMLVLALSMPFQRAAAQAAGGNSPGIAPHAMRGAIRSGFHDRKNIWDLPVAQPRKPASNPITAFFDGLADRINSALDSVTSEIDKALKALRRIFSNRPVPREEKRGVSKWSGWLVLAIFSALLFTAILMAVWKLRRPVGGGAPIARPVASSARAIEAEQLDAADQSEQEWLYIAQQHRATGNLRLALRALYLYTLVALGRAGLISLARGKSNLDYLSEVRRRSRRFSPEFALAFQSNVNLFEQSWYGEHPVSEETLATFEHNSSRLQGSR